MKLGASCRTKRLCRKQTPAGIANQSWPCHPVAFHPVLWSPRIQALCVGPRGVKRWGPWILQSCSTHISYGFLWSIFIFTWDNVSQIFFLKHQHISITKLNWLRRRACWHCETPEGLRFPRPSQSSFSLILAIIFLLSVICCSPAPSVTSFSASHTEGLVRTSVSSQ